MGQTPLPEPAEFSTPAPRRVELARAVLVAVASALVWLWHYERWSVESWNLPTAYQGDAYETLARLKAASEGDTWPGQSQVISRLGAPFGADWNAYPTPDKPLMLALGGLARVIGLFPAANAGLLLAQVSAVLAFYWVARRGLRVRGEWAAATALLFAYTYSAFHRGLVHFSFVFTWTVPLGLMTFWLVARSRRLRWRGPGALVCLGSAAAIGAHNPYNLYFWLQLMAWALVSQWLGARRRANLLIGGTAMALALGLFALMHWEHWFHQSDPGGQPLLARNYGGTERYALKPVEMFIPPDSHRLAPLAFLGQRYHRWSEWRGEEFLPYLGLAGIAGLLWLAAVSVRRMVAGRAPPGQALLAGWLLAFASVGGITNLVSFFTGLQMFRATNRVVIFLAALALLHLAVRLSRLSLPWPPWLRMVAASALAVLGLLDQTPRAADPARTEAIRTAVESDRKLAREMEEMLPPGAMVFQLPVQGFPEVTPPWRLSDYELFRPYLHTRSLRFSYGAAKYRARSRWQRDLEDAGQADLVRALEGHGFAALYLNRKGYEDSADALLQELAPLGYRPRFEGVQGHQMMIPLHPATRPVLPLARQLTFGRGWHPRSENGVRWAYADAFLSYYNPGATTREFDLRLWLASPDAQTVCFCHQDRTLATFRLDPEPRLLVQQRVLLEPGVNRFTLIPERPARRSGTGRYQLRAFGLHRSAIAPSKGDLPGDRTFALTGYRR